MYCHGKLIYLNITIIRINVLLINTWSTERRFIFGRFLFLIDFLWHRFGVIFLCFGGIFLSFGVAFLVLDYGLRFVFGRALCF